MCIPDVTFIQLRPDQSRHRITDNTYEYLMGYSRRKGVGAWQELTKGAELMLGVSMKTYIRAVDTKRKRERRCWQTGYMPTCLIGRESRRRRSSVSRGVNEISMGKTYEGLLNCSNVRSDTVYRCWVVKWRILRQHKLVNSKQHVSEKTEPMFWEPGGEWRGSWLRAA